MRKCIFLDRDGNINVEKDYLYKVSELEFEPGAFEAIKIFKDLGYLVVVVTNQSGIARGYYKEKDVEKLHRYIKLKAEGVGGVIDGFYYCPHHLEKGIGSYKVECNCRKPGPGMFLQAKKDLDIDFEGSVVVGDKLSDIEAANNLKMKGILVRTGHGKAEESRVPIGTEVYDSLYEFALKFKESML